MASMNAHNIANRRNRNKRQGSSNFKNNRQLSRGGGRDGEKASSHNQDTSDEDKM